MRYSLFVPLFLTSTLVSAFPGPHLLERHEPRTNTATHCSTPAVRKEWRDLDRTTQQGYISAVKCLATKPARVNNNTGATLYDDFATVHMRLGEEIHFVAQFFPWHRWFVHLYETALKECGYVGSATYWDWTKDAEPNVPNSPVFDPVTGFGGTGTNITTRSPIATGPFVNFTVMAYAENWPQSGDGLYYNRPHYLERNLGSVIDRNDTVVVVPASEDGSMLSDRYSETMMNSIMTNGKDFESFRGPFEGIPHAALHDAIGGDMGPTSSPNDPLFFLELNATAADMMPFLGLMGGNDLPVSDVLLTNTSILCYTYDWVPFRKKNS
ncbi:unnamed protein product [Rhizoctonia solani]|uniref:Tyrosinase copper-binding domain-containing protein n=1 Tax=Rhizoctonia solani TaxID=456999 RepID=A0A8H2X9J9_9AGAM|nr:unnamed protein product [Rhizoctonia solani]